MRIAIGSDHAGVGLKDALVAYLGTAGHEVLDLGTHGDGRVDYPDYGAAVGRAVVDGRAERGVAVCGSGIGICMAANKVPGVRAGVAYDITTARLMREHNDAQVICFGQRLTTYERAVEALDEFLAAAFQGGRHSGRVQLLAELDGAAGPAGP
jgi:ribose 5-phosphate isomerase B